MKPFYSTFLLCFIALMSGCVKVKTESKVEPIEVKPIKITIDINLKIDRQLDDFFGDLDEADETLTEPTGE